jgi:tape measure domain-containing protein
MSASAIRYGRAAIEVSMVTNRLYRQMSEISKRIRFWGASLVSMGTFGASSGGMAGLFNLLVGSQAARALMWPVQLAANLEQTEAMFTALTGSAEEARDIIAELEKFSKVAPVNLSSLEKSTRLLIGYSVAGKDAVVLTKAMAAMSRGSGEAMERMALAIGQVNAAGRLQGDEARQIVEYVNLYQLIADRTGEAVADVIARGKQGAISAREVNEALVAAASEGGRFSKLIAGLAGTAYGQLQRLSSGIRLLVRPLGQEVLPAFTGFLKVLNDAIGPATEIVKANAQIASGIAFLVVSVVGGMAALVGLGLAVQVVAFGLGGLFAAVTGVVGVMTALMSPLGLVLMGLLSLGTHFVTATESGRRFATDVASFFPWMASVASTSWGAIVNALAAGDLQAAGKVAMAGLKLVWLEGTAEIQEVWNAFRHVIEGKANEIAYAILKVFAEMSASLRKMWIETRDFGMDTFDVVVNYLAKIGQSPEMQAQLDQLLYDQINQRESARGADTASIDKELDDKLKAIEAARVAAEQEGNDALTKKLEAQRKAIEEARKAWEAAVNAANALQPMPAEYDGGPGSLGAGMAAASAAAFDFEKRQGEFGGRGLGQRFDQVNSSVADKLDTSNEWLASIDGHLAEGGFAIV